MTSDTPRSGRLAGVATLLSLVTCYGTLALVGLLGMLGFAVAINNALWAGAIVFFAGLAVLGLGLGFLRHRKPWPVLTGILGAAVIAYAMYVQYDRITEVLGFVLLSAAVFRDWRQKGTGSA